MGMYASEKAKKYFKQFNFLFLNKNLLFNADAIAV
jgi:hypothetical protein